MFFVYILKSKLDNSFYIGFAENLKERLEKHNQGFASLKGRLKYSLML